MLSSLGIAADLQGQVLGEYTYDSQKDHYVQSTSNDVSDTEPKYLYQHPDYNDEWQVGPVSGGFEAWLYNESPSLTVPDDSNWLVFNGENYIVDPDLKVTNGALKPCPGVKIFGLGPVAKEHGHLLDVYKKSDKMFNGHPVYESSEGVQLFMGNNGNWHAGEETIQGKSARLCPSESNEWEYWNGSEYYPAEIRVKSI